jgi:predicted enzyme related to lactoylglutathione lyase
VFGWTFDPAPGSHPYRHINNTTLPGGLVSHDQEGVVRPYYRVADIHGAVAKVRAQGGKAEEITQSESGLGCLCHDDQDVPFHLWQPALGF